MASAGTHGARTALTEHVHTTPQAVPLRPRLSGLGGTLSAASMPGKPTGKAAAMTEPLWTFLPFLRTKALKEFCERPRSKFCAFCDIPSIRRNEGGAEAGPEPPAPAPSCRG